MSLLRVRGKLSVLPYAPTPQQWDLATAEGYSSLTSPAYYINFTALDEHLMLGGRIRTDVFHTEN